jgi:hypothetical protein
MSKFKNTIEVIQHYGGNIGDDKALMKEELKTVIGNKDPDLLENASNEEVASAETIARQKAHAIAFLKRADKARYGLLVMELENQFTRVPTSIPRTSQRRTTFSPTTRNRKPHQEGGTQDTQTGVPKANEAPVLPLETN